MCAFLVRLRAAPIVEVTLIPLGTFVALRFALRAMIRCFGRRCGGRTLRRLNDRSDSAGSKKHLTLKVPIADVLRSIHQ